MALLERSLTTTGAGKRSSTVVGAHIAHVEKPGRFAAPVAEFITVRLQAAGEVGGLRPPA